MNLGPAPIDRLHHPDVVGGAVSPRSAKFVEITRFPSGRPPEFGRANFVVWTVLIATLASSLVWSFATRV